MYKRTAVGEEGRDWLPDGRDGEAHADARLPAGSPGARRAPMDEQGANDRLVRAARELLRWDQRTLAERSGVGIATVRRFETGASVGARSAARIAAALRAAGVMFIGAGEAARGLVEGVALDASGVPLEAPARRVYKPRKARAGAVRGRRATPDPG